MNQSFSLYRVGLLIKRQWASFGKIFLIALGTVTLVLLGFYAYNLPREDNIYSFYSNSENEINLRFSLPLFCIVGILFVSLSANWYFVKWGQKANALEELMLPVSNIERTICGIFLTMIVCVGSYLIVFFLIDGAYRMYVNQFFKNLNINLNTVIDVDKRKYILQLRAKHVVSFVKTIEWRNFTALLIATSIIQSIFLLGSIYFKRFQYIKTAIVFLLITFITINTSIEWTKYLTRGKIMVFHTLEDLDRKNDSNIPIFFYVVFSALVIVFYAITYLRVKEKEI